MLDVGRAGGRLGGHRWTPCIVRARAVTFVDVRNGRCGRIDLVLSRLHAELRGLEVGARRQVVRR